HTEREQQRGLRCLVHMRDRETELRVPNSGSHGVSSSEAKSFHFDHCFWSHDGFLKLDDGYCAPDPEHERGSRVYKEIGQDVVQSAWQGYNAALMAYGQSGSGKSYSIIGYGANIGIVPRLCEDLFQEIEQKRSLSKHAQFEVDRIPLCIYCINTNSIVSCASLRCGENIGFVLRDVFIVEMSFDVVNGTEWEQTFTLLSSSVHNRTYITAVFSVTIISSILMLENQLIVLCAYATQRFSSKPNISFYHNERSERQSSAATTGDRLREGISINQSLSCLGNCIHALAEKANGKSLKVPYRESTLTRLLMNALGGNSKTIMLASISPADIHYEETLSTLRYGKPWFSVNLVDSSPDHRFFFVFFSRKAKTFMHTEKGINRSEYSLRYQRDDQTSLFTYVCLAEVSQLKQKWEDEMKASAERLIVEEEKKALPHLTNVNMDPLLSGRIVHVLQKGVATVGKADADITLLGVGETFANDTNASDVIAAAKLSVSLRLHVRVLVIAKLVIWFMLFSTGNRIVFGQTQLYVFVNPRQADRHDTTKYPDVTYESAQEEIASKAGIKFNEDDSIATGQTITWRNTALLNRDLVEVLPRIEEANAMSEELDRGVHFEVLLVAPQLLGKHSVFVKVRNSRNGQEFDWTKEKFLNRAFAMKEMYQNYACGESWEVEEERDPFLEDPYSEVRIGTVQVYLQPLAYMVELKEQLEIVNFKGEDAGILNVSKNVSAT
ncbi:conserved hypothetical protein, partial [Ixodes scapularis]